MPEVPQLKKTQWPAHITNALGIPSVQGRGGPWHSTGDTTDVAWFHAMCDFFGVDYPGERIRSMRAIMEAAGGTWNQRRHSSAVDDKQAGGNVRKEAFEDLWTALHISGFLDEQGGPSMAADVLTHHGGEGLPDARWTYRHIRLRQGQPGFRHRLLQAYGGRCAVTDTDIIDVLEAAHIEPHAKGGSMETANGLLLRADLHTLFDLGLLAIDTDTWTIVVHPRTRDTNAGSQLHGMAFRRPGTQGDHPSVDALDGHRARSGL